MGHVASSQRGNGKRALSRVESLVYVTLYDFFKTWLPANRVTEHVNRSWQGDTKSKSWMRAFLKFDVYGSLVPIFTSF